VLPISASLAIYMAYAGAAFVAVLAALFIFAPQKAFEATKHRPEEMALVMAGRYIFMAFILIVVTLQGDLKLLAAVFFGLAGLAFIDAAIYGLRGKTVAPHIGAGLASLVVPLVALGGKT